MSDILKKKLQNALKLSGFNVRREFCNLIVDRLLREGIDLNEKSTFDSTIEKICGSLESQSLCERSIEKEHIDRAIERCLHAGYDRHETIFSVINFYDYPKLTFDPDRKLYSICPKKSKLLTDADVKAKMFLDRYYTILQRTKRSFAQKGLKLQTVDYLLTLSQVSLTDTLILGCLLQVCDGKYCLEDPSGMVQLDLSHAKYHGGFFVENSFLLANGYYEDKTLYVSTIILPPGEEYKNSSPSFGNINYFGGISHTPLRGSHRLAEHLSKSGDLMMLFSDVWLDHPMIFEKLETIFEGLQHSPPIAFIFMGNFMSESRGSEVIDTLRKLFKKLGELISRFTNIINYSNFVFVPGLADPCTPHMVPRLALPNFITQDLKKMVPKAIFATNPCRLQYCTREIVLFRADIAAKLLQGTLHKPQKDEIGDYVTNSIVSQGHLSPMSLNALTVHWDFDHCLQLYPLPDLVVIGDKTEMYDGENSNCQVVNPGSFCDSGFQFKAYTPSTNKLEDCSL